MAYFCSTNCQPCYFNTSILFDLSSCKGLFIFTPDLLTVPGPCGLTGPNTSICPLDVYILKNCKGDYKITLLDDADCPLNSLILKCSQFVTKQVNEFNPSILSLYESNKRYLFVLNANNQHLISEYVEFEESAYYYRRVTQSYLNLWCDGSIICNILNNTNETINALTCYETTTLTYQPSIVPTEYAIFCGGLINMIADIPSFPNPPELRISLDCPIYTSASSISGFFSAGEFYIPDVYNPTFSGPQSAVYTLVGGNKLVVTVTPNQTGDNFETYNISVYTTMNDNYAQFIYSLSNNFIKSRTVALKQLCECGKVCNDFVFTKSTNPCQTLRNCCYRNY